MNDHPNRLRRLGATVTLLALCCGTPAVVLAQSDTNHGSTTGISNANQNGLQNSNVNGIGTTGTAPVPEASTYAMMAALVAAAAYARRRRRTAE